jgi:mono/diheme cytochrome c family protein
VRSAFSSSRFIEVVPLLAFGLAPLLSGCDLESYPAELSYPQRTDPIVIKLPGDRWDTTGPGQADKNIAAFDKQFILDPKDLDAKDRQELDKALTNIFGTPAEPRVKAGDSDVQEQAKELGLDDATLKAGSKHYRRHCMHCHGVAGDGRGPTGPWVNPLPRDYRQGLFKFISTDTTVNGRKPRRQDLHRTLEHGIDGTSMPSFGLLEEKEKEQLISYVIHLSLRGEVEMTTMRTKLNKEELEGGSMSTAAKSNLETFLGQWSQSNAKVLQPVEYPYEAGDKKKLEASIRHGYELFTNPQGTASCITCHVDFGRQVPFRYDEWGTLVRPANLTAGIYRGGRRPIDLYWRIRGGIRPSGMPSAELKSDHANKTDEYWDVVNFVQALPYPRMLPEDIRDRIYPRHEEAAAHAAR